MNWQEYLEKAVQQPLFDDLPEIPEYRSNGKSVELRWYSDPRSDNQKLMSLQYEYRNEGNRDALKPMFQILKTIAAKYINTIAKKNKRVENLSLFDKECKAANAATYMVEQMILRPDFVVKKSFTGYLFLRVEYELFYHRKVDKIVDYVDLNLFFKEGTEPATTQNEFIKMWEENEQIKKYIAIGEDGTNLIFDSQDKVKNHFCINTEKFYDILESGRPVAEPGTYKIFYIDEMQCRTKSKEAKDE